MDEKAEYNWILVEDKNPVDFRAIKPNFPNYDDLYIHLVENPRKMTKLARKERRLIVKMFGKPKEELIRKMRKLKQMELEGKNPEISSPEEEHKSKSKHKEEEVKYEPKDDKISDIIAKKSASDAPKNSDSPDSHPLNTPQESEHKESEHKESEHKESEHKESEHKESDHKKDENKMIFHSKKTAESDSDLDDLSDDEYAKNAKGVKYEELKRTKKLKKDVDKLQNTREYYEEKLDKIRTIYPTSNIPAISEFSSIDEVRRQYKRITNKLRMEKSIEKNSGYMFIGLYGIEYVAKMFNVNIEGFAEDQMANIDKYNELLVELGERKYASFAGNLPVEVRLMGMMMFNAAMFFVGRKMVGGTDKTVFDEPEEYTSSLNIPNSANRKWRRPSWGQKKNTE